MRLQDLPLRPDKMHHLHALDCECIHDSNRTLSHHLGLMPAADLRLIKGSIERTDEWKSHMVSKPLFESPEACVAKEVRCPAERWVYDVRISEQGGV